MSIVSLSLLTSSLPLHNCLVCFLSYYSCLQLIYSPMFYQLSWFCICHYSVTHPSSCFFFCYFCCYFTIPEWEWFFFSFCYRHLIWRPVFLVTMVTGPWQAQIRQKPFSADIAWLVTVGFFWVVFSMATVLFGHYHLYDRPLTLAWPLKSSTDLKSPAFTFPSSSNNRSPNILRWKMKNILGCIGKSISKS